MGLWWERGRILAFGWLSHHLNQGNVLGKIALGKLRHRGRFVPAFEPRSHCREHVANGGNEIIGRPDKFIKKELNNRISRLVFAIQDVVGEISSAIKGNGLEFASGEGRIGCLTEVFAIARLDDGDNFAGVIYVSPDGGFLRIFIVNRDEY
jgi:hypothetical protein